MNAVHRPQFITRYKYTKDETKPGRVLESAKIGGIYMSRISLDSGAIAGNLYHKETNTIFFVTAGEIKIKFVDINTKVESEIIGRPGFGIVHHPPQIALAVKNISVGESVMVTFSDRKLRSGDDYEYLMYKEEDN